jgi:hypothetical protein
VVVEVLVLGSDRDRLTDGVTAHVRERPAQRDRDVPPPAFAAVPGQLRHFVDQPGPGQHLEVVADVADVLAGALRQLARRGRAVDAQHLEQPAPYGVAARGDLLHRGPDPGTLLHVATVVPQDLLCNGSCGSGTP